MNFHKLRSNTVGKIQVWTFLYNLPKATTKRHEKVEVMSEYAFADFWWPKLKKKHSKIKSYFTYSDKNNFRLTIIMSHWKVNRGNGGQDTTKTMANIVD